MVGCRQRPTELPVGSSDETPGSCRAGKLADAVALSIDPTGVLERNATRIVECCDQLDGKVLLLSRDEICAAEKPCQKAGSGEFATHKMLWFAFLALTECYRS